MGRSQRTDRRSAAKVRDRKQRQVDQCHCGVPNAQCKMGISTDCPKTFAGY